LDTAQSKQDEEPESLSRLHRHVTGAAGEAQSAIVYDAVRDRNELGAHRSWMRNGPTINRILIFAANHGFVETQRFTFDGVEIVTLELALALNSD
jgi:hypothetical protein